MKILLAVDGAGSGEMRSTYVDRSLASRQPGRHALARQGFALWIRLALSALAALALAQGSAQARSVGPDFASLIAREEAVVVSISITKTGGGELDDEGGDAPRDDLGNDELGNDELGNGEPGIDEIGRGALISPFEPAQLLRRQRSLASGFVIGADGLILTSAHAVSNIDEATVRLADQRQFNATVVGLDKRSDVAVIKIETAGLPVAVIGDPSQLKVGDWVAAIGAPFGLERSVTAGIVSAKARFLSQAGGMPFIQTDVALNRGSSGGPLFNLRGEVVGINSMIYSDTGGYMGVSFTLPIDIAMKVAAELRTRGHVVRAYLGAQVQQVTPALAQAFGLRSAVGALVVRVDRASPAERAGMRPGDIVLGTDDSTDAGFAELQQRVASAVPGNPLKLNVWRAGRLQHSVVKVIELTPELPAAAPQPSAIAPAPPDERLGLVMSEPSAAERSLLKIDGGLWVRETHDPALRAGIRPDDLVLALNDVPVTRLAQFDSVLAALPAQSPVALLVMRDGAFGYVAIVPQRAGPASP